MAANSSQAKLACASRFRMDIGSIDTAAEKQSTKTAIPNCAFCVLAGELLAPLSARLAEGKPPK